MKASVVSIVSEKRHLCEVLLFLQKHEDAASLSNTQVSFDTYSSLIFRFKSSLSSDGTD